MNGFPKRWGGKQKKVVRFAPSGFLWGSWEASLGEVFKLSHVGPDCETGQF